jgi:hypothetical protein
MPVQLCLHIAAALVATAVTAPGCDPWSAQPSTIVDRCRSSTYIDDMSNEVTLAEAASGQDPAEGLRAARALRELAERLEILHSPRLELIT